MRYPEFLKQNQTIGFVAPSMGAATEPYASAFQNAVKTFGERGYLCQCGPNVTRADGIGISAPPEDCGQELTEMYCSSANRALISVGGGELMCEILDHVDFERIRDAVPKWYMGYSDNTNFTFLLPTLADTAAIYGPCAGTFGMEPWHESVTDALDLLTGQNLAVHGYGLWENEKLKDESSPLAPYNPTEPTIVKSFHWGGKPLSGRFIGGCTDCLVNLTGTKYDRVSAFTERYKEDGIIWFLESCDLSVFAIRRAMWQMKHAGWFEHAKAFIIGRPLVMGQEILGLDQYEAVLGVISDLGVPVIMDADLGHLPPMMPMISGGFGTVEKYGENNIRICFETV